MSDLTEAQQATVQRLADEHGVAYRGGDREGLVVRVYGNLNAAMGQHPVFLGHVGVAEDGEETWLEGARFDAG